MSLKYVDVAVTFAEIPDETTLAINISNCPCHCEGCHSSYLANDIGTVLTESELEKLIKDNDGITCVCFMGGDADPERINRLAEFVREEFPGLKIGWYSGRPELSHDIRKINFDYLKIGPYIPALGPLNKRTTNQRLYLIEQNYSTSKCIVMRDITSKFWKKKC